LNPRSLMDRLGEAGPRPEATLLPDFFFDHFLPYGSPMSVFFDDVSRIASHGGGNIPFKRHVLLRGGNATNTASALARLGARVHLIVRTDSLGLMLLKYFFRGLGVDLSHVKTDGRLASTIALEVEHEGRLANVMINDSGSVVDFGFNRLTRNDLEVISNSDIVGVFNWTQNLETDDLLRSLLQRFGGNRAVKVFFDPSDPTPRAGERRALMDILARSRRLDVFSINENEAVQFALSLEPKIDVRGGVNDPKAVLACARFLHERLGTQVDLHTKDYATSFVRGEMFLAPSFKIEVRRSTGAGDAWNAGDIYGGAWRLSPEERLLFAHAVAGYYISSPDGRHPSKRDLKSFLRSTKVRKLPKQMKDLIG